MSPLTKKSKQISSKRVLLTSFAVNMLDLLSNTVVALITGSAVMAAAALQSLADTTTVGLVVVGRSRSKKRADKTHPFGFGKESYFWSLLSAAIILLVTASSTLYFGFTSLIDPTPVRFILIAYVILSISVITNAYSFSRSAQRILEERPARMIVAAFKNTIQTAPRTTFVVDGVGFLAPLFGLIALSLYGLTGKDYFDGLGAVLIGCLLVIAGIMLLLRVKNFITGARAPSETENKIRAAALSVDGVEAVLDLKTMLLGSENTLINIELHIKDDLVTDQIEILVDRVKHKIREAIPGNAYIQVEPETP